MFCSATQFPIQGIDKIHAHSGVKIFTYKTTPLLIGIGAVGISLVALGVLAKLPIIPIPAGGMYALATFGTGVLALDAAWLFDLIKQRRSAEQNLKDCMIYHFQDKVFKENLQKLKDTELSQSKDGCFTFFVHRSAISHVGIIIKSTRSRTEAHIYTEKTEFIDNKTRLQQSSLHWRHVPADAKEHVYTDWSDQTYSTDSEN